MRARGVAAIMTGSYDPYRIERNAAWTERATDCPSCEGAWFAVVFVFSARTPEALGALPATTRP